MGWRLGGKGASGRGENDRIEEHGLHLWMGFYENAFRLMRECYAERHTQFPNQRFADWQDAFKPAPDVGIVDKFSHGWQFWFAHFPAGQGLPGDPTASRSFSASGYLRQTAVLLSELLRSAAEFEGNAESAARAANGAASSLSVADITVAIDRLLRYGQLASLAAALEAMNLLHALFDQFVPDALRDNALLPLRLLDGLTELVRTQLNQLIDGDHELRRLWIVVDVVLAVMRGSLKHGLPMHPKGFDAINDYDWREWLAMNGASSVALESGFIRAIYDLTFAYEDGDVNKPRIAAGVALRGAMRMFFTYRGAFFWRMSGGMGDVVFAPLYQVLKERGVRFEFFHRLKNVSVAHSQNDSQPYIDALEFDVQAKVKGGKSYDPLVSVHGVPSWPAKPDYAQLAGKQWRKKPPQLEAHGEQHKVAEKTLRVSDDFDAVVLGVSIGAIPYVASELVACDKRWRAMTERVKTVPTQAFQVWLNKDVRAIGAPKAGVNLSGYVEPFDTWADMSHLIAEESGPDNVRSIAYFCSVLEDVKSSTTELSLKFQKQESRRVRDGAIQFLQNDAATLWPKAAKCGQGFDWRLLADGSPDDGAPVAVQGKKRFHSQFWTANINPSDRYVLSLPGTSSYRISPLEVSFDNLTIAGDWTQSGLDSGCIESAVMSGLLASHAISASPPLEDIVGYDHP